MPSCPQRIAAWSPAPPRQPTNHSASPQSGTSSSGPKSRPFTAVSASMVATTTDEELESPAATGMSPHAITSIPQSGRSVARWRRNTAPFT